MLNRLRALALAFAVALAATAAQAAYPTIYVGTGGSASNSGSTNANSATVSGTQAAISGSTITLDNNTNLTGIAVDGSQTIFLNNATNANQKVFAITSITGCTGSGACSVGVTTFIGTAVTVTCTTCTGSSWAIGGKIILPDANIESAYAGGTIISIDDSQSCSTACIAMRGSGDATNGRIVVKPTTTPVSLTASLTNISAILGSSGSLWWFQPGITFAAAAASTVSAVNDSTTTGVIIEGATFSNPGSAAGSHCVSIAAIGSEIRNSTFQTCGADGVNTSSNGSTLTLDGNFFGSSVGGNGVTIGTTNYTGSITGNIFSGVNKIGISFTGTPGANTVLFKILGNTIVNSGRGGIVSTVASPLRIGNNILANNNLAGTTTYFNISMPAPAVAGLDTIRSAGGTHDYNLLYTNSGGNNVSNYTLGANEVTTAPAFGTGFSIPNTSPAYGTGAYQHPGGYSTANTLINMGAFQGGTATAVGGSSGIMGGGF